MAERELRALERERSLVAGRICRDHLGNELRERERGGGGGGGGGGERC